MERNEHVLEELQVQPVTTYLQQHREQRTWQMERMTVTMAMAKIN
jgi:hypothetical protein